MARNEQFRAAAHFPLPVPAGTKSGDPVRIGSINGVAQTNVATADDWAGGNKEGQATVWVEGSFHLPVTGAVAAIGDPVYWTEEGLTGTSTGAEPVFGAALASQSGDGNIPVKLLSISAAPAAVQEPANEGGDEPEPAPEPQRTRARAKS